MPFSMRVVNSAARFGACVAEEVNRGPSNGIIPRRGHGCIDSLNREPLGNPSPGSAERSLVAILSRNPVQQGHLSPRHPDDEPSSSPSTGGHHESQGSREKYRSSSRRTGNA
jgi:hypothetical protein